MEVYSLQTEHVPTQRKKKYLIGLGSAALIIMIAAITITVFQSKSKAASYNIRFANAAIKELSNTKLIEGQIVPGNIEMFYPDTTKGKVKDIYVKTGQEITKGTKLFTYDNSDLTNQLQQLEIDKKSTNIQLDQENKNITSLQIQIKDAKNTNAPQDVITPLESQLQDLQIQLQTTQLTIQKNKLQEQNLQNELNDLIVYSGTTGIVQQVNQDADQSALQSTASQTTPIVQISSRDPFVIQGTLTELQKSQIQPNQPITVTAEAVPNKIWKGKITEISNYPDTDTLGQNISSATEGQQTQNISYYNFKAVLDSQDGLSPGYHVAIQVNLSTREMLVVPSSSIVDSGNSKYVYVVKNNMLKKQNISTGLGDGNSTEVLKGLKAGDKVVNNPSDSLYNGMDVKTK